MNAAVIDLFAQRIDRLELADESSGGDLTALHNWSARINLRRATAEELQLAGHSGERLEVLTICDETHSSAGFGRYIVRYSPNTFGPIGVLQGLQIICAAPGRSGMRDGRPKWGTSP